MAELRWLLLLIGIGVIAAVYIYTRYKPGIAKRIRTSPFRREPRIGDSTGDPGGNSAGDADHAPAVTSLTEREPVSTSPPVAPEPRKVVAIRLVSRDTSGFSAERLILTLRELGLRHGQFGIFHRMDDNESADSQPVFSVASLVEPGSFDLTKIKTERYLGVSIFLALPGPREGIDAFDDMLDLARELALRLEGNLSDEQGGTLSVQRERYMREEVIQFSHRNAE